jgi:hypothetical protein
MKDNAFIHLRNHSTSSITQDKVAGPNEIAYKFQLLGRQTPGKSRFYNSPCKKLIRPTSTNRPSMVVWACCSRYSGGHAEDSSLKPTLGKNARSLHWDTAQV